MRLTAELINNSISFLNPLKERELDLRAIDTFRFLPCVDAIPPPALPARKSVDGGPSTQGEIFLQTGHKIPAIENLAVAGPQDAIDFTDNDIALLGNFPLSPRLRTLLLARNRLTQIQTSLATNIPNLTVLVLTQNSFAELADLDVLGRFASLTHLSLLENPVCRKENYRNYIIFRIPSVRFLDFQKVRDVERERAKELFGTVDAPNALATRIMGIKSHGAGTFETGADTSRTTATSKSYRVKLTDKEKKRVEKLIRNATSLQEISRLEKELNEGRIPGGVGGVSDEDD